MNTKTIKSKLDKIGINEDIYKKISEYLNSGKTINFTRLGHDYELLKFFPDEMKFEARRIELFARDINILGKLPVSSYEVEEIYNKISERK